jgi:NTE family protein
LRVPIDFVAGTSMGAVVGGLYASGVSPAELDSWFRHADWHFLLSDSLPRASESFRNKEREFNLNRGVAFTVSRDDGLELPAGLTSGRNVMASLRQLTIPTRHVDNFDRLPIPFRAVATDFESGELVVLSGGDLVISIRASMAVPALFAPQRIGERLLADGGMANNLPISVVQEMGADAVIAIDTTEKLKKADQLDTAAAMALQVLTIFTTRETRKEMARLGPGDVLVPIEVEGLTPIDFAKASRSIDAGYEQTMQQRAALVRLSVGPEAFRRHLARQRVPREERVMISSLRIRTPDGEFNHRLKKPVEFRVTDEEVFTALQSTIGDLGVMQAYEVSDYQIIGGGDGYGLLVTARKKKTGPAELRFGFDFGYSSTDETDLRLLLSHRMTELNSLGGEWENQLSLGNTTRIGSEWYQPVDGERRYFFAANAVFGSDFIDGRDAEGDPLRFRQQDYAAGLDFGTRFWQAGELRLGYARGSSRISRRLGVPDDVPSSADRGWVHADLIVDTLNAPNFATRGAYGRVSIVSSHQALGASDDYTRVEGQVYRPITFGKNTLVPRLTGAVKVDGGQVPLYDQVPLGGFLNLSGLSRGGRFGQNAALAELVYFRKLGELNPGLGRGIYAGVSLELGETWDESGTFDMGDATAAGSVFLGADTFLGGLYLGAGVTEDGDAAVYFHLGTLFGQGRH